MSLGTYKVVLLGEGRVGKTSIASRFVDDKFDSGQISTVQANMYSKKRIPIDGTLSAGKSGERSKGRKYVDIALWDTAGQERYHALGPIYYRNANGAVLVYDITDADTFERIRMWIKELRQVVGDNIHIVICGNKSDLEKEREVNLAMAEKFAKQQGATHFSTSAKTNEGVNEAFQCLVQKILESLGLVDDQGGAADNNNGGDEVDGGEDDEEVPRTSAKKGGKKATSPTTKRGGVKIALDGDEEQAASPPQEDFPATTTSSSSAGKKSSSSGKKALKVADDDTESARPSSSGYGYDDYGSYGGTSSGGGYGDYDGGANSSSTNQQGKDKSTTSTTTSQSAKSTGNNSNAKPAPPTRKETPADSSANNSASNGKKQPITLDEPKKDAKGGKDGKKKDCAC